MERGRNKKRNKSVPQVWKDKGGQSCCRTPPMILPHIFFHIPCAEQFPFPKEVYHTCSTSKDKKIEKYILLSASLSFSLSSSCSLLNFMEKIHYVESFQNVIQRHALGSPYTTTLIQT